MGAGAYSFARTSIDDGLLNAPPIKYGTIICYRTTYPVQLAFSNDSENFYIRGNYSGAWAGWKKVSLTNMF